MANEKGCSLVVIDCTNKFTANMVKKLGFKKIYALKYEDYKLDGKIIFKPESPHVEASVFLQQIT